MFEFPVCITVSGHTSGAQGKILCMSTYDWEGCRCAIPLRVFLEELNCILWSLLFTLQPTDIKRCDVVCCAVFFLQDDGDSEPTLHSDDLDQFDSFPSDARLAGDHQAADDDLQVADLLAPEPLPVVNGTAHCEGEG